MQNAWHASEIIDVFIQPPDEPARPPQPILVSPGDVPRRRLGSDQGKAALLHAIAHIEFNAIDLAADMIARFACDPLLSDDLRTEFISDWIKVCFEEAYHFSLVRGRLQELGYDYGDFPAHNGLWEAAVATQDSLAARLAIAPLVLEARGLDVTPGMIAKFEKLNDRKSADILKIIYRDEIGHVATGMKWFEYVCGKLGEKTDSHFHALVENYFKGRLKRPFNTKARNKANFPEDFYLPLS